MDANTGTGGGTGHAEAHLTGLDTDLFFSRLVLVAESSSVLNGSQNAAVIVAQFSHQQKGEKGRNESEYELICATDVQQALWVV